MNDEISLKDRDPQGINTHVKVQFYDVLAEPNTVQSFDTCWSFSALCYGCCKDLGYNLMTCFFGLCIAAAWGCEFGYLAFYHIWFISPIVKIVKLIFVDTFQRCFKLVINCCIKPCTIACARIFRMCGPDDIDWSIEERPPSRVKPIRIVQKPKQEEPKPKKEEKKPGDPDVYLGDKEKIKRSVQRQLLFHFFGGGDL
ncbi:hypothetical protein KUTeg_002794 [Tegillarca granosa]|uniref:Caveolin n=1 Tax=Tegillarca granosa TaxID=220873 RepID=A0ABQ9FQX8_TEGGR|nr:hypothetical protein KUTeg_002794 [Tegillarca granosa]